MNSTQQQDLTDATIHQRVAMLKRFRTLLQQQRDKFRQYLSVLEAQEISIANDDIEKVVQHTELEESIITEIESIQKVIDPLAVMYQTCTPQANAEQDSETEALKQQLQQLQTNVIAQNKKNRETLQIRLAGLRKQIASLHTPPQRSTFNSDSPSLIDIQA